MLKKIIAGLILAGFIFTEGVVVCVSDIIMADTPAASVVVETQAPTEPEPTAPPINFVDYNYIPNLQKTEIENQLTILNSYITYLKEACQTYSEVENEVNYVSEIINQYEIELNDIVKKENHYNKCYAEYPEATAVWFYMKNNFGWSDIICAGIMGNIMAEIGGGTLNWSGKCLTDKRSGYGMFQWVDNRRKEIKNLYGDKPTMEQQLEFMYDELYGTDGATCQVSEEQLELILNGNTPERVAHIFAIYFERCASYSYGPRKGYARIAYNYFVY